MQSVPKLSGQTKTVKSALKNNNDFLNKHVSKNAP